MRLCTDSNAAVENRWSYKRYLASNQLLFSAGLEVGNEVQECVLAVCPKSCPKCHVGVPWNYGRAQRGCGSANLTVACIGTQEVAL